MSPLGYAFALIVLLIGFAAAVLGTLGGAAALVTSDNRDAQVAGTAVACFSLALLIVVVTQLPALVLAP
ncbi:hypothetical protein [Sphingomonas sp.]|jgi:hypothetical protein|uniref:hypothetical protein n=1 Tax=Sphingomonas sp. TaxID=28214 RepID=UPI002ED8879A